MLLAVLLVLVAGCDEEPSWPARSDPDHLRGVTLADWTEMGYAGSAAHSQIAEIADVGANLVVFLVTVYQDGIHSAGVDASDPRTPGREAVAQGVTWAREEGLTVGLKLHVDLRDGSWRGHLDPPDPAAWFAAYQDVVLSWADFAAAQNLELFVPGTELASLVGEEALWRELLSQVRAHYPGLLVYAASWDEAARVPFWDAVDLVGINVYFPVMVRPNAGRLEILAGWQPWLAGLSRLREQAGRPLLFTEIGYRSVDGAGLSPYAFGGEGTVDLGEQADLYWAALEAAASLRGLRGLVWWNWLAAGGGGPGDEDYTPRRKPAAQELAWAWKGRPGA